jgi:glycosyltransferase involved in cell wall biosynthesis
MEATADRSAVPEETPHSWRGAVPVNLYAVTMVRNEADIIEQTLRHLIAEGVDRVYVADNMSTDDTPAILQKLVDEGLPLVVTQDDELAYNQDQKMTKLARRAMAAGSDWVLPFDADEFFYGTDGTLRQALESCPPEMGVIECQGWDHLARDDSGGLSAYRRTDVQVHPKVLFRASTGRVKLHMGNHGVDHPLPAGRGPVEYRHFQYRTFDQYKMKVTHGAKAYEATDFGDDVGTHWRQDGALSEVELRAKWEGLCAEPAVFDPAPIREAMSVTIIVPTLGARPEMLDGCVRSIEQTAPDAVVVVQGDAARDGFAMTCNRGAKNADTDLLCFLNDDTVCHPGWLEAMVRRHRWGIVGAHLTYPDDRTQHSGVFFRRNEVLEAFNRQRPAPSGEVPAVTGACLLISRELFDQLGGFDESFMNGYEDVDLCLRARQAGHGVWYAADSHVTHLESQSEGRFDHAADNIRLLQERWGDLAL